MTVSQLTYVPCFHCECAGFEAADDEESSCWVRQDGETLLDDDEGLHRGRVQPENHSVWHDSWWKLLLFSESCCMCSAWSGKCIHVCRRTRAPVPFFCHFRIWRHQSKKRSWRCCLYCSGTILSFPTISSFLFISFVQFLLAFFPLSSIEWSPWELFTCWFNEKDVLLRLLATLKYEGGKKVRKENKRITYELHKMH